MTSLKRANPYAPREGANKALRFSTFSTLTQAQKDQIALNRLAAVARRDNALQRRQVMAARNKEAGYYDNGVITQAVNSTGYIALFCTLTQGPGATQRVGKRAFYKSIQWRSVISADTTTTSAIGAWLIVYDRRPTGVLPAVTDIINSLSPLAMNNDDNAGRFQIVHRRDFAVVGNTTTPSTGMEVISDCGFIKFRRQVDFKSAGTGAIGDIEQGALYYVSIGSVAAGTADATHSIIFRTRFTEE